MSVISTAATLRPTLPFGRYVIARALERTSGGTAEDVARGRGMSWASTPEVIKAVTGAITADSYLPAPISTVLVQQLRAAGILGTMLGTRTVPDNVRTLVQTGGLTAAFTGEGAAIAMSAPTFATPVWMRALKVSALWAATEETLQFADPGAEAQVGADGVRAAAYAIDQAAFDPTNAGIAEVKPASLTYSATKVASTGSAIANVDADLKALIAVLVAGNVPFLFPYFVMSPTTATSLGALRGSAGSPAYPMAGPRVGSSVFGIPTLVSTAVSGTITLIDASQIIIADGGQVSFDVSVNAALEMNSAPGSNSVTPSAASMVNMFNADSVAMRLSRWINFMLAHPAAAAVLTGVAY